MNTKDYARSIGVSQRTVQRWIKSGQLEADKIGNRYSIPDETPEPVQQPAPAAAQPLHPDTDRDWLTTAEMADELGVSQRTVQRRIKNGEIQARKVNGKYQIPPEEEWETLSRYEPEQVPEDEDDDFEITDESTFEPSDLRKEFATFSETEDYAIPIPVPYTIIKNASGLFRVVIEYDSVIVTNDESEG